MFYTQGHKDQRGRGSATDARVERKKECPRKLMDPEPCIEPVKPLVQVRDIQEGMSEVLPSEH